jgi:predicted  nucleic acid-binding Zn-ribbon protein
MSPEAWSAIGVVLAAIVAYLGVRYTSQQSTRAQKESVSMEEKAIDAAAYERARESYERAIAQYLREITRLEERVGQLNSRIIGLNEEVLGLEESKRAERARMLEELERAKNDYEAHIGWCSERVHRLRLRLSEHEIVDQDDPDLRPPV